MTGKLPENLPKNYPIYSKTLPQWLQTQQNLPKVHLHPHQTSDCGGKHLFPWLGLRNLRT